MTTGERLDKVAFGGGCHWCTEAVFQCLKGVIKVEQGFVASTGEAKTFSEAVIVHFNTEIISLSLLIEIHLFTHKSTSAHSMRSKYRSAVYTFSREQGEKSKEILQSLRSKFEKKIITEILAFLAFKPSVEEFQNYYKKDPAKPFCRTYIDPKLKLLIKQFSANLKKD